MEIAGSLGKSTATLFGPPSFFNLCSPIRFRNAISVIAFARDIATNDKPRQKSNNPNSITTFLRSSLVICGYVWHTSSVKEIAFASNASHSFPTVQLKEQWVQLGPHHLCTILSGRDMNELRPWLGREDRCAKIILSKIHVRSNIKGWYRLHPSFHW